MCVSHGELDGCWLMEWNDALTPPTPISNRQPLRERGWVCGYGFHNNTTIIVALHIDNESLIQKPRLWFKNNISVEVFRMYHTCKLKSSPWVCTHVHVLHWWACFRATHIIFLPRGRNYWQRQSFPLYAPVSSPSIAKQFPLTLTSLIFSTKWP